MDIKIGVLHTPREILVDSTQSQAEIEKDVTKALESESGLLTLEDRRGRRVLVPVARIAYVEIDESDTRRVGFSAND